MPPHLGRQRLIDTGPALTDAPGDAALSRHTPAGTLQVAAYDSFAILRPQRGGPQQGVPQQGVPQRGGPQRGGPQRGGPCGLLYLWDFRLGVKIRGSKPVESSHYSSR